MWRGVVLVTMVTAVLASGAAPALDKFTLNVQAYKGITLGQLLGTVAVAPSQATAGVQPTLDPNTGISLGTLSDLIYANLQQYAPATDADAALAQSILGQLAGLRAFLAQTDPNVVTIKNWRVRNFFEEDMQATGAVAAPLQGVMSTLFQQFFQPLEQNGLTLPWLLVAQRKVNLNFVDLVYSTRFILRFGGLTYENFFEISMDDPLIDDEMANLGQQALQVGLLGSFQIYKANPSATVDSSNLDSPALMIQSMCCDKTQRICMSIGQATVSCSMCGNYCCLGSNWCPNN